jgi:dihydrodipicolinate synthase/N-acetylneuraminate lyase
MTLDRLTGIVPSLNTPFTADDGLDLNSVARLVDHVIEAGCGGMLVLAVAGETASLTPDEKRRLLAMVVERNAGRLPVIAGVSAPSLERSLALADMAAGEGADALLWQAPDRPVQRLRAALLALGERCPLMLQDLDWSGEGLPVATILALAEAVPALRAVKVESTRAGPKYTALLERSSLRVTGGWAVTQMPDALARGIHAFMPTGMERVYVAIFERFRSGDIEGARALFESVLPVLAFANQHIDVSIRLFKMLRVAEGVFACDHCRVAPLDPFQHAEAERLVRRALVLQQG